MALKDFMEQIPETQLPPDVLSELEALYAIHGKEYVVTMENHPELMKKCLASVGSSLGVGEESHPA